MSAQPAKRRKTSPLKATPVLDRNVEPASAPRASFMSPTRASLARFNPALLPQARSASAGTAAQNAATPTGPTMGAPMVTPDQFLAKGQEAFNYIMGNFSAQMQQTLAAIGGQANSPLTTGQSAFATPSAFPNVTLGEETDEQMEAMRAAIRARKEQERTENVNTARTAKLTPTSARRGLQPEAAQGLDLEKEEEEENDELSMEIPRNEPALSRAGSVRTSLEPRSATKIARLAKSSPYVADEEMDELSPDVPHQNPRTQRLATEDDGLPDTPEAIRRQLEAEDHPPRGVLFSSPSKRRRTQTTPGKSRQTRTQKPQPSENQPAPAPQATVVPAPQTNLANQPDPKQRDKEEEKDKLELELRKLRKEVNQFEHYAQIYTSEGMNTPDDIKPLVDLLNSSRASDKAQQPEPALSLLLTSFLPFSIPVANPPTAQDNLDHQNTMISHEPLKEKDPLPLNSLFTPLSIVSSASAPVQRLGSDKTKQEHKITLASPGSLLTCSLDLTVSSEPSPETVPTIENLKISDLSSWARAEVGTWLEERCKEGDIAAVGYGLGRYWDISVKRAQCWMQCQKTFPRFLSLLSAENPDGQDAEEVSGLNDLNLNTSTPKENKLSKRQLIPHLGRSQLALRSEEAVLQLTWKLQFDWTGDAESVVSAEAGLPQSWHEADSDDVLRKIPATFDALMREGGVMQAVKVVAGLLFDTQA